jgi:hypothetical protein
VKKQYDSKPIGFAHRLILWEASEENNYELEKGEYSWEFSFQLPEDLLPSMYFEDWLYVFYQARAYVQPQDKDLLVTKKAKMISPPGTLLPPLLTPTTLP